MTFPYGRCGRLTLLRAKGDRLFTAHDPEMGWGKLAEGGVSVPKTPGSHLRIFKEPTVQYLAQTLRQVIQSAAEQASEQ